MAQTIESERCDSSTAHVPAVPPARAIVYTRYDEQKRVVINPDDFHRLAALENDLAEIVSDRLALSELAPVAHRLEDTPGTPIEDPTRINALLGL
jgi:hypothetical protein